MDLMEILQDSLMYPLKNIPSLVVYVILCIIASFALIFTVFGTAAVGNQNAFAGVGVLIIGLIVSILIFLIIEGYVLDIIKIGIKRGDESPSIDIQRQALNGFKLFIVAVAYFIIPLIITVLLSFFLATWLTYVIAFVLFVVFALAETMAQCRLAQTDELGPALAVGEAIGDISRIGFGKVISTIVVVAIVAFIIAFILALLTQFNSTLTSIVMGITSVYLLFFSNRAIGLLYSDV